MLLPMARLSPRYCILRSIQGPLGGAGLRCWYRARVFQRRRVILYRARGSRSEVLRTISIG